MPITRGEMRVTASTVAPDDLLAGITEGYIALDAEDRYVYVNHAAAAMLDASRDDLLGEVIWERFPHLLDSDLHRACRRVRESGESRRVVHFAARVERWFSTNVSLLETGVALYFHDITAQKVAEAQVTWLAAKEAALRWVAEAVARDAPPQEVHALIAREAAVLLGAHASAVMRYDRDGFVSVQGAWRDRHDPPFPSGLTIELSPNSTIRRVHETGTPQRDDGGLDAASQWGRLGCRAHVAAPVLVGGGLWGAVSLGWLEATPKPTVERDLADFTDLAALAVGNAASRARLADQASRDPLTGLLNHRSFHERLNDEVARARRYDRALSLAVLDVDGFKPVNDAQGHQAGDRLLAAVAAALRDGVRAQDRVARIGGDEFAILLPETAGDEALAAVEHLRTRIAAIDAGGRPVTASAGVCDLRHATDGGQLFHLADGALYWSKAHGRNAACLYDPRIVRELSAQERADHLARSQALTGLRGLARAIDAKDPSTKEHSDRVARIAERLALELGWGRERAARLREAALLHDVGKIGVPDAVLLKPGRLTPEEYEVVKGHAGLGAQIVDEILLAEQVDWVRHHHERPDGRGYPDALAGDAIPEGAAILAVADAFDVMSASRPYSTPVPADAAVEEIRRLAGMQFVPAVSAALAALHERGEL